MKFPKELEELIRQLEEAGEKNAVALAIIQWQKERKEGKKSFNYMVKKNIEESLNELEKVKLDKIKVEKEIRDAEKEREKIIKRAKEQAKKEAEEEKKSLIQHIIDLKNKLQEKLLS